MSLPPEADEPPTAVSPAIPDFQCRQCGSRLQYQPGTTHLSCRHCGSNNPITATDALVQEHDFLAQAQRRLENQQSDTHVLVRCEGCGAQADFAEHESAKPCVFCGRDIIAAAISKKLIRPQALLAFKIPQARATQAFEKWLAGLWFAPFGFKQKQTRGSGRIEGVYLPYWTYDCATVNDYQAERGIYHYETRTRRVRDEKGREYTQEYQHRVTHWQAVQGQVLHAFDDVLIPGSRGLPADKLNNLTPWDTENLEPYQDEYLAGFKAECYQVDLVDGFDLAKQIMDGPIREHIRRDIGGDEQRIHRLNTRYSEIRFKHILLPVWISAYLYKGKSYRFLVNARSGEVQGERPWSYAKIGLSVLAVSVLLAGVAWWLSQYA